MIYSLSTLDRELLFQQQLSITYNRLSTIGFEAIDETVSWLTRTLTGEKTYL